MEAVPRDLGDTAVSRKYHGIEAIRDIESFYRPEKYRGIGPSHGKGAGVVSGLYDNIRK